MKKRRKGDKNGKIFTVFNIYCRVSAAARETSDYCLCGNSRYLFHGTVRRISHKGDENYTVGMFGIDFDLCGD